MKLFRRMKRNNKGLSLVELICAVAVFGVATTAIGSVMVVSAQNYSRGTYELDVQKEAQSATNLVGNLLIDAVEAEFDKTTNSDEPKLTITGENKTYTLTWNKNTGVLHYVEEVTGFDPNTGVLAQNVTDFDVDLTKFENNKNAQVTIEISKNEREYVAEYNTTSRNGSANNLGAVEQISIVVDNALILEPKQTYYLPVSVVGSATNYTISAVDLSGAGVNGSSVNYDGSKGYVVLSMTDAAEGTMTFDVVATDNNTGAELSTEEVEVSIRRVNDISCKQDDSTHDGEADADALVSGSAYADGAIYKLEFVYDADNTTKMFGKACDFDYVDPLQMGFNISMSGISGSVSDYVKIKNISYGSTPYVELELEQDMPNNSSIKVEAVSKHAAGTNKTGTSYDTVEDVVCISKVASIWGNYDGDFNRGNDGPTIEMTSEFQSLLVKSDQAGYGQNNYVKYITVYEAKVVEDGEGGTKLVKDSFAFKVPAANGTGTSTMLRPSDSYKLYMDKNYILEFSVVLYKDKNGDLNDPNNVFWPITASEVQMSKTGSYPVTAMSVDYEDRTSLTEKNGSKAHPYEVDINSTIEFKAKFNGLDLAQNNGKDYVQFKLQKDMSTEDGVEDYQDVTLSDYIEEWKLFDYQNDGSCKPWFKGINSPGSYRLLPYIDEYKYYEYNDENCTNVRYGDYDVYDNVHYDYGVVYIEVE